MTEREWIRVRCYEGRRGQERPVAVTLDADEDEIEVILEQWIEEVHGGARTRFYRVQLASGRALVIARDSGGRWYLHAIVPSAPRRGAPIRLHFTM